MSRLIDRKTTATGRKSTVGSILLLVVALAVVVAVVLPSCKGRRTVPAVGGTIAVSIEPLRYFTEQIVGDRFHVVTMVPKGYSPETYEPTPEQLISLSDAKAYIKVGNLGFESTWLDKISKNEPNLPIFSTSDSLESATSGIRMSTFDTHTWTAPQSAEIISKSICEAVCRIDSGNASLYRKNLSKLIQHIHSVDGKIHQMLADLPTRAFVAAHPSLSYFASQYGLFQYSIEKDGKEPTPQELSLLIRQCRQEKVRVILVQEEFNQENAQVIHRETGASIVRINPLNYQWDEEMLHVAKALKEGK